MSEGCSVVACCELSGRCMLELPTLLASGFIGKEQLTEGNGKPMFPSTPIKS